MHTLSGMPIDVTIPLQSMDCQYITLEDERKLKSSQPMVERSLLSLRYRHTLFTIPNLSILTPPVRIHSWNVSTGKLDIDLSTTPSIATKFASLQSSIISFI